MADDLSFAFRIHRFTRLLRGLALAATLAAAAPVTAAAQMVPGVVDVDFDRARREFTADALRNYNRFMSQWSMAWQRKDMRALMAMYSGNPTVVISDSVLIRDQTALGGFLEKSLPAGSQIRLGTADFVAGEGLSYSTGLFVYQETEEAEPVTGTHLTVLHREAGRWRIRSQVFTPPLPLAARTSP